VLFCSRLGGGRVIGGVKIIVNNVGLQLIVHEFLSVLPNMGDFDTKITNGEASCRGQFNRMIYGTRENWDRNLANANDLVLRHGFDT